MESLKYNYNRLLFRERHEKFQVINGRLEVITSLKDKINYLFQRKVIQEQVRVAVEDVVRNYSKINLITNTDVKFLFLQRLSHLSTRVFDRNSIDERTETLLENTFKKADDDYDRAVRKVRLAMALNVGMFLNNGGCSGSYQGKDIRGNTRLIFKPSDEAPELGGSPKLRSKITYWFKKLPWFKQHENLYHDQASRNEARAYQLDQLLGFNIVPITKMETFESPLFVGRNKKKEGSCQLWVEGAHLAGLTYEENNITDEDFEKLVLMDVLMGNQDRHCDNWMIKNQKVVLIDNGSSHPYKYFTTKATKTWMYDWRHLPNAQKPFVALKNIDLDLDYSSLELDADQQKLMNERIAVLKKVINEKLKMAVLGEIRDEAEFKAFLS